MVSTRDRFVETACELLEAQGYHATGLNQIIEESGAPRGSLYYYFPDGKEELAAEAIHHVGEIVTCRIQRVLQNQDDSAEAVRAFIRTVASYMEASDYAAGGPITTVALESATTNSRLNDACQVVYDQWQTAFAERLVQGGIGGVRAQRLAVLIVAALEGGIVLSRTAHSTKPLERVADEVATLIDTAQMVRKSSAD
jgi:TetR/AcrR family transcriptional repressor of lmrAB and yxaGH operons